MIFRTLLFFYVGAIFSLQAKQAESHVIPFIKIEPVFTGNSPLYLGQRFYLGYRYTFNTDIDLTEETLPLLEARGFKKIGEKQIVEREERGISLREVVQKVEAMTPGTYTFGVSSIKGYSYAIGAKGEKVYQKTPLHSETKPLQIVVRPFPEKGRPPSFNGAVGDFSFQAELAGSPKLSLGDPFILRLKIEGEGELDTVHSPELCCQPGFSGFFEKSDLPPFVEKTEKGKIFHMQLELKNRDSTRIPPIEFSFFDPKKKSYAVRKSEKIALEIIKPKTFPSFSEPPSHSPFEPFLEEVFAIPFSSLEKIPIFFFLFLGLVFVVGIAHFCKAR